MLRSFAIALFCAAVTLLPGSPASACGAWDEVAFFETDGDIFEITNKSQGPWAVEELTIRLTGSRGRLFFDTAEGGPGASMPEPSAPVMGAGESDVGFLGATVVNDGDEQVTLRFSNFQPGREFMFVVDVDDRLENSDFGQAVISGDEIDGAGAEAGASLRQENADLQAEANKQTRQQAKKNQQTNKQTNKTNKQASKQPSK